MTRAEFKPHSEFLYEGGGHIVIFTTHHSSKEQIEFLRSDKLKDRVEVFVHASERVDLKQMMQTLHELGIERLMVEGGAMLNFELIRLGLVDEISAYVAPMIFGGEMAPTLAAGSGLERSEAVPLKLVHVEQWDDGGVLLTYQVERKK